MDPYRVLLARLGGVVWEGPPDPSTILDVEDIDAADRGRVIAVVTLAIQQRSEAQIDYRVRTADSRVRVSRNTFLVVSENLCAVRLVGVRVDVTESHEQHQREASYQAMVDTSADAIALLNRDGTIRFVTDSITRTTGYAPEELIGRIAFDHIHPDDRSRVAESFGAVLAQPGVPVVSEYYARHRDGSWHYREVIAVNRLDDPAVAAIIVNYRDATARKRTEEELRLTSERLHAIVSTVPIALWAIDSRGVVTLSEGSLLQKFGFRPGELVGQSVFDLYSGNSTIVDVTRRALQGESPSWTLDLDGTTFDGSYTSLRDETGALIGAIGVATDVTQRTQLEQQLRQAHKMEAVGRLAGGIAHDFSNLLTAMVGYTELILSQLPPEDPLRPDVEQISNAGRSAGSLTRQLLTLSRKQILEPRVLDLNQIIRQMDPLLRRLIGEHIQLEYRLADSLDRVNADPGQIEQVILNLALNARDAMPDGGLLSIETANVSLEQANIARGTIPTDDQRVMLSVGDTGVGIDESHREHIFEPFFTTKEQGKGTGLGLATVYGIVNQSGGSVVLDTQVGKGTTFRIFLPRTLRAVESVGEAARERPPLGGAEAIMIVEDNVEVRSVTAQALKRHGYTVIEAENGVKALAAARSCGDHIHLLITDMVMPGLNGRSVADRLLREHPTTRVLFMSGYGNAETPRQLSAAAAVGFIQKPFTPRELLKKVRELLDSEGEVRGTV